MVGALAGGVVLHRDTADAATGAQPNGVAAYGAAADHGSPAAMHLTQPLLGVAATPSGNGYWLVAQDGGVFAYGDAAFYGSTGGIALVKPVVGVAATPTGRGYWLVAQDGGVFAFGDAAFYGSTGGLPLVAPIVGMAATPTGRGYWLVAQDGGVFAFGDAAFYGSTGGIALAAPVVGIASSPSGLGYWLVGADGGVFAFGDAAFHGASLAPGTNDVVGIAPTNDGGYLVAHRSGQVDAFGTVDPSAGALVNSGAAPTVGIAARPAGGYWTAQGGTGVGFVDHDAAFLVCTRSHESSHTPPSYDDGYGAVNPSGTYRGAYQFSQSTWNNTAVHVGRVDLVGVDPARASVADQDTLAWALYQWQGASPWLGRCAGL
jgi:hypothetical protein